MKGPERFRLGDSEIIYGVNILFPVIAHDELTFNDIRDIYVGVILSC